VDDVDGKRKQGHGLRLANLKKSHSEHGLTSAYTMKNARFINFYSYAKSKNLLETGSLPPAMKKTKEECISA